MTAEELLSTEEGVRAVYRLMANTELAYALTRQIKQDVRTIRHWQKGQKLSVLGYALGTCLGDAEVSENRLAGLRQELIELLDRVQDTPPAPQSLAA